MIKKTGTLKNKKATTTLSIKSFIQDTKAEIKKVTWPSFAIVSRATGVIILIVLFFTAYITSIDFIFSTVFNLIKT